MPNIIYYIRRPAVFEPETITVMGEAYERALASFESPPPKVVREVIAARIIDMAGKGERDPHQLCQNALETLGARTGSKQAGAPSHP